jgi:hypothetical protein
MVGLSPLVALGAFASVTDPGSATGAEPLGNGVKPGESVGITVELVIGPADVALAAVIAQPHYVLARRRHFDEVRFPCECTHIRFG